LSYGRRLAPDPRRIRCVEGAGHYCKHPFRSKRSSILRRCVALGEKPHSGGLINPTCRFEPH